MKFASREDWLVPVLIVLAVFLTFSPAFHAGFMWDDDDHFTHNPLVMAPDGIVAIWTSAKAIYYPLTLTTWWTLRHTIGLWPLPYHLLNVALHAATALLFWMLLRRMEVPGAWLAAILWAIHPLQVETAAWATELKNTQSGVFFFITLILFLSVTRRLADGRAWRGTYALTLAAFFAALASKPSTVPLPGLLVLWLWHHDRVRFWPRLPLTIPFFVLGLASAAWTVWEQRFHSNAQGPEWDQSFADRLVVCGRAVWFYLASIFVPGQNIFIYPRWNLPMLWQDGILHTPMQPFLWLVGTLTALVVLWRGRAGRVQNILLAALAFLGLLFPVLGFFNIYFTRFSFVADHFAYLASTVPIAATVAVLVPWMAARPALRPIGLGMIPAAVIFLGAKSFILCKNYQNETVMWTWTTTQNPNAWIGWNNLGHELIEVNREADAIPHLRKALTLKNDYEEAYNNMGRALLRLGEQARAIPYFERALRYRPAYADALSNMGVALAETGALVEGEPYLARAIALNPVDPDLHANHGTVLAGLGRVSEALVAYRRASALAPENADYAARASLLADALGTTIRPRPR